MPLFILRACRTPVGTLGGSLRALPAPALAAKALRGLLAGLDGPRVEACLLGQAIQAGSGANPAAEAALAAGMTGVAATTLNQGLASGLQAVLLASRGDGELAVAGGMESASCAPYLLPSARWGTRMGAAPVLDALLRDAAWPSPVRAEGERQRFLAARDSGGLREQIAGPDPDDDPPPELLPGDGAAVLLLGSERQAALSGSLARIVGWAQGEDEPEAIRRALGEAGLKLRDLALEADGPLPGVEPADLGLRPPALALGAEGARRVVSLAHRLREGKTRYGLAALACPGLGLALILERT